MTHMDKYAHPENYMHFSKVEKKEFSSKSTIKVLLIDIIIGVTGEILGNKTQLDLYRF